jgi:Domain of unknown function (DUF4189)
MALRRLVSSTTVIGLVIASSPALAVGSVAIGLPGDVAQGGFAMGITYNYGDQGASDAEALKQCLNFMDAPDATRALCKVYTHFTNQCFAMAMDPEPGTYGFGYKIASSQSLADSGAMNDCKNTSGADRKTFCQVSYRTCDGTAR